MSAREPAAANHYEIVGETTWPVDLARLEWQLRYAPASINTLYVASVVCAYAHLTDPTISQRDAIAALRRARRAVAQHA